MNTLLDIVLWGIDQDVAEDASDKIFKRIRDLQKVLDRFDPKTETFKVNKAAFFEELEISTILSKAIKAGINDFHRSEGYFNVFSGEVYSNLKTKNGSSLAVPSANCPKEIIVLDESSNSVRFLHPHVSLDFGGTGKGLALDEASIILDEMKIENAFISFGGSSILTRGHHPHGEYWPFSFQDKKIEGTVWALKNDAVSVSCATHGSQQTPHILNPKTGAPTPGRTAAVQSDSATEAEVLSTTLIAAPPEKHQEIASHFNVKKWAVFPNL